MSLRKLSPAEFLAQARSRGPIRSREGTAPSEGSVVPAAAAAGTATVGAALVDSASSGVDDASDAAEDPTSGDPRVAALLHAPAPDAGKASEYVNSGRGGVVRKRRGADLDAVRGHRHLEELFARVNSLLGGEAGKESTAFAPRAPQTLRETGMREEDVQRLVLKFLLQKGAVSGREISQQIKLPFGLIDPLLKDWRNEQLIAMKGTAEVGDYVFAITDIGRERARRYTDECTYFGAAPVSLRDYLEAMAAQSTAGLEVNREALERAFSDLLVSDELLEQLGPAINSGRGMFLFGEAGNGKTSIAERVTRCFGDTIWIPRALGVDGEIIRLFDPGVHEEVEASAGDGLFDLSGLDARWVRVVRPTIVAGGELTMSELEVTQNPATKICEAPLQLKSNGGTLVIDDFGRQTMPVSVLLNRWIVPLEKRYDFLNLPSGKKIQAPFDQLIIFATNLEPRSLVDGAFLRRIPYKIKAPDPTPDQFRKLCEILAPKLGLIHDPAAVDHLLQMHFVAANRPLRSCLPRDLLLQVKNYCTYKQLPKRVTAEAFDYAVANYFSVM